MRNVIAAVMASTLALRRNLFADALALDHALALPQKILLDLMALGRAHAVAGSWPVRRSGSCPSPDGCPCACPHSGPAVGSGTCPHGHASPGSAAPER